MATTMKDSVRNILEFEDALRQEPDESMPFGHSHLRQMSPSILLDVMVALVDAISKTPDPFVIFDLDGVLADCNHRLPFILNEKKKRWDEFYRACVHDRPMRDMIHLFKLFDKQEVSTEIRTGRSDVVLSETVEWLRGHLGFVPALRMRKDGDYRPDYIVKAEWLLNDLVRPVLAFDDRPRVVDMYRDHGIPVMHVPGWQR